MKSNSLEFHALVAAREGLALTAPITERIEAGTMLALRGRNGSGKSTLLKTIAGLLPPLYGSITLNGSWLRNNRVLYLGHQLGLSLEMTVEDNVRLWARLAKTPELVAAALHYFDLSDIRYTSVGKLSAGWRQRVALTRLITVPSKLWLLDEPTANLDKESTTLLQALIESRVAQNGIVVVATHVQLASNQIKMIDINEINKSLNVT